MKVICFYCIMVIFILIMNSCRFVSNDKELLNSVDSLTCLDDKYRDVEIKRMMNPDTLILLKKDYPYDMDIYNDMLYVIMAKADTCIHLFDKHSGKLISRLGTMGQGPQDVISPDFVKNNYGLKSGGDGLMLYDLNAQCQFWVNSSESLNSFSRLEETYNGVTSLNLGNDYAVGRQLRGMPLLFQIFNKKRNEIKSVDLYPLLPESVIEPVKDKLGFLYSANMLCNFSKNRIIVSMYYFDLLQVYDLEGHLQKIISLERDYNVADGCSKMFADEDYIGYSQCYATDKYCYFRRNLMDGKTCKSKASQLIKVDWSGEINEILEIEGVVTSGFCVDDKYLYCTVQSMVDKEEAYLILRYNLNV